MIVKKINILLVSAISLSLIGCQAANIISAKWDSGLSGANAQTRCEEVDMRSNSDMKALFTKYDGWKLIYLSEFTTSHKTGTSASACFERSK